MRLLRLYDARAGRVVDARPAGRLLRVSVAGLDPAGPRVRDLRALLTGDLIRRLAELRRAVVLVSWDGAGGAAGGGAGGGAGGAAGGGAGGGYDADCVALGLRPAGGDGGTADIQVGGSEPGAGVWVRVGASGLDDAALADLGLDDPLALRLGLLERPYREPAGLTPAALAQAGAELAAWRGQVAEWATHPSQRLSADWEARVTEALADDLDAPGALAAMRELAGDPGVPPGAKWETTAHLDQLTGLDLAREVGR